MNSHDKMTSASQAAFDRLLETIRATADVAIHRDNVSSQDKDVIKVCLSDLNVYAQPLNDMISNYDAADHIIEWIGAIVSSAFYIGSYGVMPESSYKTVQQHQAFSARVERKKEIARKSDKRNALLRKHIPDLEIALLNPSSTAEAILQAVNRDLVKAGERAVTSRTVLRWITKLKSGQRSDIT